MAARKDAPMIYRMIYINDICEGYSTDLNKALDGARSFYAEHNITGALWFDGEHFIQLLEGAADDLQVAVKKRLISDCNKGNAHISDMHLAKQRQFPDWTMSYLCEGSQAYRMACQFTGGNSFDPHTCADTDLLALLCTLENERQKRAQSAIH